MKLWKVCNNYLDWTFAWFDQSLWISPLRGTLRRAVRRTCTHSITKSSPCQAIQTYRLSPSTRELSMDFFASFYVVDPSSMILSDGTSTLWVTSSFSYGRKDSPLVEQTCFSKTTMFRTEMIVWLLGVVRRTSTLGAPNLHSSSLLALS